MGCCKNGETFHQNVSTALGESAIAAFIDLGIWLAVHKTEGFRVEESGASSAPRSVCHLQNSLYGIFNLSIMV